MHTRELVAQSSTAAHKTEHVSGSTMPGAPINFDALYTSDKLIMFLQAWVIELSYGVNGTPLTTAAKFKLRTDTSSWVIEAFLQVWIEWIQEHENELSGKIGKLHDDLEQVIEKTSQRYPLEARQKTQTPRFCPICTKESAVVASWPQNQAPQISCIFCGWNFDIDWSTLNAR